MISNAIANARFVATQYIPLIVGHPSLGLLMLLPIHPSIDEGLDAGGKYTIKQYTNTTITTNNRS